MVRKTTLLYFLCLFLTPALVTGEGVRELRPDSTISSADLYFDNDAYTGSDYTKFGLINCPENVRLNIHIKSAGETILFGLKDSYGSRTFNLRKPDGTIAMSGTFSTVLGQPGYIRYYHQAVVGPFPTLGGYVPLAYTVSNPADTGDYYFEISNLPLYGSMKVELWDFQVVSGEHTPAIPSDMINGRVWSKAWQVNAELSYYRQFNGSFFVYANDGIVTKLALEEARVGVATFFCNPYGCLNTGNFINDRKSNVQNTYAVFPGIADYKLFLNDPDSTVYPSGVYGQITGTPAIIPDPAYPLCDRHKLITVHVNKSGRVEINILLPYGAPATTVFLYADVQPGLNQIPWDGLDGQGNAIPDGTLLTVTVTYLDGLTNFPIWDQEQNPNGYTVTLIRPESPTGAIPQTYWDDTNLNPGGLCPSGSNLTGCLPASIGCHTWSGTDCHNDMINTWWYSGSSTVTFNDLFQGEIGEAVAHSNWRCGQGSVLLHATVDLTSTVDWYDSITGGTLLHAGDTNFLTPVLTTSTTFFAEARSLLTSCISPSRSPATATILPSPVPTIQGPDTVCAGTSGHSYQTETGKNNYEWWLSSGGVITSTTGTSSISVTWTDPGHHTVFANYTDLNGCPAADPAAFRVVVLPFPDSAGPVTGPTPVCAGSEGLIYATDAIPWAQTYAWSLPAGFTITAGAGTNSITVSLSPTATSGEVSVRGINLCGEGMPSPVFPVTVTQPPTARAGPGDTICQRTAFTVTGATASDYTAVHWITTGTGTLEDASTLTPKYIPGPGETGSVLLTLVAEHPPCEPDSSAMTLWIATAAEADAGPDRGSCHLSPVYLESSSASNYQFLQWGASGTGTFDDIALLHPVYFPSAQDVAAGSVILTLTAVAEKPCPNQSDELLISFSPAPEGDAGPDGSVCQGTAFQVIGAVANHYSSLLWEHSGEGTLTGATTLSPLYVPASGESGTIFLTISVYGNEGCSDSTAVSGISLHLFALEVNAGPDQEVDSGSVAELRGMAEAGSGSYQVIWEPASQVANPNALETTTYPLSTSSWFFLTVTDQVSGCIRSDSLWIEVMAPGPPPPAPDCLEIYNVITPNGDGVNDTWIITCIEQHPNNSVQILNRWGNRIVTFEGYNNTTRVWDGTNKKGEPVPDGTYYYIMTIREMKPKTGWVFVRGGSK